MILFHGSIDRIEAPRIMPRELYRPLDLSGGTIKFFNGVSIEWLRFIAKNRLHGNVEHGYDVVVGPVANDRVYTVLNLYEGGFIDEKNAIERMKPYRLANQYLFHTPLALSALKFQMSVEVSR